MAGLRLAAPQDAAALLAIYAPYIATPVTFEERLPDEAEFARRVAQYGSEYPYLVWQQGQQLLGYAYAHRAQTRPAYRWNAEASIYLAPAACRRGLGTRLYGALLALLELQGLRTVYGLVTLPNPASEALHRRCGFRLSATFAASGYKCGAWRDLAWFEKNFFPPSAPPAPPRSIRDLPPETCQAVLRQFSA